MSEADRRWALLRELAACCSDGGGDSGGGGVQRLLRLAGPPIQRTSALSKRPLVCLATAGDLLCKDDNSEVTMASLNSDPSWCCMFEYGEVLHHGCAGAGYECTA